MRNVWDANCEDLDCCSQLAFNARRDLSEAFRLTGSFISSAVLLNMEFQSGNGGKIPCAKFTSGGTCKEVFEFGFGSSSGWGGCIAGRAIWERIGRAQGGQPVPNLPKDPNADSMNFNLF